MKWLESRVFWGLLLILGGALFLLENLGVWRVGNLFWAVLLVLGGIYFLTVYFANRINWWALIPGIVLLDLALTILLGLVAPSFERVWGGPLFLAGIGLSFWLVYFVNRNFWWAIIPGGVLFTLAVVAGLESTNSGWQTGGIFFLGLGLTFAILGVLPTYRMEEEPRLRWAFIPATILVLMGVLLSAAAGGSANIIWPVALILVGTFLVLRTVGLLRL